MKAITVHQPYATLIAIGAKRYETRSWPTQYRGPIAIHAGKNMDGIYDLAREAKLYSTGLPHTPFAHAAFDAIKASGYYPSPFTCAQFPVGSIVATGELVDCFRMGIDIPNNNEYLFGFWSIGRYAWKIANVKFFDTPIPARGQQGLWDWQAQS
jgi:activating signal cointegrator 1